MDTAVEEEVLKAKPAPEPGTFSIKEIIHKGDEKYPVNVVADSLESAGWVFVYHTQTGDRSLCNRNMLRTQLEKTLEDGKTKAFTVVEPKLRLPYVKRFKCLLHPDSPDRAHYDSLGLPVCTKPNLKNQRELEMHMQKSHKAAWAAIKQERERAEREEDRALQRSILKTLTGANKGKKEE